MIAFSYYLLKVIICSAVLFAYYLLALRNKVFHGYNRFYLLTIVFLSLTLPCLQFNIFQKADVAAPSTIKILQVVTATDDYVDEIIAAPTTQHSIGFSDVLLYLFITVCALFLISIISLIVRIIVLQRKHKAIQFQNIYLINTDAAKGTPFSFFRTIFWNNKIDIQSATGNRIFKHELAHIQELHSYDKLFISLVLAIFWCNPIFWLIKKELHMLHGFIADKYAVEDGNTADFASMLLAVAFPQHSFGITNHFFYSPIKRRLAMITKNKNPKVNYLGRIIALPLAMLVFTAFTIKVKTIVDNKAANYSTTNTAVETPKETSFLNKIADIFSNNDAAKTNTLNSIGVLEKTITVVIDAAHGGTDDGAIADDGITKEKDLCLALLKKIKALNTNDKIKLIFTREEDVYQSVKEKADFAKAQNADLFISLHIDAVDFKKATKTGFSIYVSKDEFENSAKSKAFASAMISVFKSNYEIAVTPNPVQRKQGVWVIQANSFPSILLEAGYISNPKDLAYLKSEKGQEAFAQNVLNGIVSYATANNLASGVVQKALVDSPPQVEARVEVGMAEDNEENAELLKHPRMTIEIDLTNKQSYTNGVLVLNGKKISRDDINNKTIKGGTARIYRNANKSIISTYGSDGENGAMIFTNSNIIETVVNKKDKIIFTVKTDTIIFVDASGNEKVMSPINKSDYEGKIKGNQLYILDGKISTKEATDKLNPESIDKVNVLKGKQATDKYGDKAKDGAIEITTKGKAQVIEVKGAFESNDKDKNISYLTNLTLEVTDKLSWAKERLVIINAKVYDFDEINHKTVRAKICTIYKKGTADLIRKYGAKAKGTVMIFENASIEESNKYGINISSGNVYAIDASQRDYKKDRNNYDFSKSKQMIVIDGKVSDLKAFKLILVEKIVFVNVLKNKEAIEKYGQNAKDGVLEITTKKV